MTFIPSAEQRAIIEAGLEPQCVIACPGSGKTATAVRRLVEIRRRMGDARGFALLLSYSNVAVETFRGAYNVLARESRALSPRVTIETVDSLLATHILRPHGARAMGSSRQPFLVNGSEPFLSGFTVYDGRYPRNIANLTIGIGADGDFEYTIREDATETKIAASIARAAIKRLGATGAYTHELGRFWSLYTLVQEPRLLAAFARKFPHVIVDEAQDIGPLHGEVLMLLSGAGATVSLIGDPNQAIFEFAGANGNFLRAYSDENSVESYPLSENRRSVRPIVDASNLLAGVKSTPTRTSGPAREGVYYLRYEPKDLPSSLAVFETILADNGYDLSDAAVLCRGRPYVAKLTGAISQLGTGATPHFALAAIRCDRDANIHGAYESLLSGLLKLFLNPPNGLRLDIMSSHATGDAAIVRRLTWNFLRDRARGLPPASLRAESQWHPALKESVERLLSSIEAGTSLKRLPTWTRNLTRRDLSDTPLWRTDLANTASSTVRVDTVHKAKGESIRAVLYLARSEDINAMVGGTGSEEGRIGYVALTRAKDLFVLGVPRSAKPALIEAIEAKGFEAWPA